MAGLLSIIVPVYNESATIGAVIDRLLTIDLPLDREIIVVNDGSTDGTRAVLDAVAPGRDRVAVVHLPANRGKGHAVRVGLARTRGTITAIQDADLELDPAQLKELVQPILRGEADAVYGSRFLGRSFKVPLITPDRQQDTDLDDQHPLRSVADRHGNLLQDHSRRYRPCPRI